MRAALLAWYRRARRDLPWRHTRDPYAIWISEVMLQQTRVETVRPYYERFLARWPTVEALADADPEEVRASWSGLGYYRRARLMLEAAQVVMDRHGGALPNTADALAALPGFGRYTAGAVASIAFGRQTPAVDGNVTRVLARVLGLEEDPTKKEVSERIWSAAAELARGPDPGDLTQALIELGATVCTPRNPACAGCPLADACAARREGRADRIPPPKRRAPRKRIELTALVLDVDGHVLLAERPAEGLFGGLFCPPLLEGALEPEAAIDEAERGLGLALDAAEDRGSFTHVLTHRDLVTRVIRATPRTDGALRRVALEGLDALGLPTFATRALRAGLPREALARARLPGRRTAP